MLGGHVLLGCLFVGEVEEEDAGEGADEEDDVEPSVVEVELQLSQNFGHDGAILQRHAHPHEENRRHKVHPHNLSQDQHYNIGGLAAGDGIEELSECDEKASNRGDDDDAHQDEGDVLRPELHIKLNAQVVNCDLNPSRHWISLPYTVEHNVDGGHEDFPNTVNGEEIT